MPPGTPWVVPTSGSRHDRDELVADTYEDLAVAVHEASAGRRGGAVRPAGAPQRMSGPMTASWAALMAALAEDRERPRWW